MKQITVVKFGGTSLSHLGPVGVVKRLNSDFSGQKIICVLSAEKDATNTLIEDFKHHVKTIGTSAGISDPDPEDSSLGDLYDLHVSYGEVQSVWRAGIAARQMGINAKALNAAQAGIQSSGSHRNAIITNIDSVRLLQLLDTHSILFVAGFQGVTSTGDITTLGRGSSDLTAVAIAGALQLGVVYIYTDVDGIFTIDPRLNASSQLIRKVSYSEALELSTFGNKVIHERAVSLAHKYCTDIIIRNSLHELNGAETVIASTYRLEFSQEPNELVTGIAVRKQVSLFRVTVENTPGSAHSLYSRLVDSHIPIYSACQGIHPNSSRRSEIMLTVDKESTENAKTIIGQLASEKHISSYNCTDDLSEISLVGRNLERTNGFIANTLQSMRDSSIEVVQATAIGIRVTLLVSAEDRSRTLQLLHENCFES